MVYATAPIKKPLKALKLLYRQRTQNCFQRVMLSYDNCRLHEVIGCLRMYREVHFPGTKILTLESGSHIQGLLINLYVFRKHLKRWRVSSNKT